jgi:hypothetical protein
MCYSLGEEAHTLSFASGAPLGTTAVNHALCYSTEARRVGCSALVVPAGCIHCDVVDRNCFHAWLFRAVVTMTTPKPFCVYFRRPSTIV